MTVLPTPLTHLSVKSGGDHAADRDKKLRVMKDSTTGAIGVTAIVMTLLLKFLFLNNMISSSLSPGRYAFLFLMPVFSKWGMILNMYHGTSARQDGLGKMFIENITLTSVLLASLSIGVFLFCSRQVVSARDIRDQDDNTLYCPDCCFLYFSHLVCQVFQQQVRRDYRRHPRGSR